MARILILGGFERSGHDSIAQALCDVSNRRGNETALWVWREHLAVDELLVFNLHRIGAQYGMPGLESVTADPDFLAVLRDELENELPADLPRYDCVISAHPWSTLAACASLHRLNIPLIDCHAEFSSFPVYADNRISAFVGTWQPKALPLAMRPKLLPLSIPVRYSFTPGRNRDKGSVVVNTGATGWFRETAKTLIFKALSQLRCARVSLLLREPDAEFEREAANSCDAIVTPYYGLEDIGPLLATAEYFLTKPGGAPIAEGLAAGCKVLAIPSGISWEEESLRELVLRRIVVCIRDGWQDLEQEIAALDPATELRSLIRGAASAVVRAAESLIEPGPGKFAVQDAAEIRAAVTAAMTRDAQTGVLPHASRVIGRLAADYLEEA